jgi:superfamily II DNA or RNA helicase
VREADLGWLRDYQRAAYEACVARTRGIIQMPTGGGKTEVLAALVTAVPTTWLIIVPQADLLGQTADRIEKRTGERPGIIGDGEWAPSRVTVATFQTLHRRMSKARDRRAFDFVGSRGGVIVDECHSAAAGTLSFVLSRATSAYYRIGFSATPLDRSDRKSILVVAQLGGIIHRTTSAELRAIGMLAGYAYPPLLIVSAAGLTMLMLLGVATRIRIGDSLTRTLPAIAFFVVNGFVLAVALWHA